MPDDEGVAVGRSEPGAATTPGPRRRHSRDWVRRRRRQRRRRRLLAGVGVAVLVLVGLGVWLAVTGRSAYTELVAARAAAAEARAAAVAGDPVGARSAATRAAAEAASARAHTSGPAWWLAARVPVVGSTPQAVRGIAAGVDDLASQVLLPAADAATTLDPATLRPRGGQVDLAALRSAAPVLARTSAAAEQVRDEVAAIPTTSTVGAVEQARAELVDQTASVADLLRDTSTAAELLPPMLGGDGPRSYFVAFQTNAEARGTGGLVGAFGVLRADGGAVSLDQQAANTALVDGPAGSGVDLGPDFDALWGRYDPTTRWINSNLSAHFPHAARIWQDLWQAQTGQRVDGVVATDPVALSYLLGATGPVTLPDGEQVTAENVVALTESEVYARFDDDAARKDFLQTVSTAVVETALVQGAGDTSAVLAALGRGAGEGRVQVWSADAAEQAVLAGTPLAGLLPPDGAPSALVSINNSANGKLDYYSRREIAYEAGSCDGVRRSSTVTATVTNTAPAEGLPDYVTIQSSVAPGPVGTNRSNVALYATPGALLTGVTVDGRVTGAELGTAEGHPVYVVDLAVEPGQTRTITWSLDEPVVPGPAVVPVQPLVLPATVDVRVPVCASP